MPAFNYRQHWYRRAQLTTRAVPAQVENWLFDTSSLTARLIQRYGQSFNVQLLSQTRQRMNAEEKSAMNLFDNQAALQREVLLCDNKTPLVYARTVIPLSTLSGPLRRYAHLGERPLGAILFADRTMRRGEVEVTSSLPQHCVDSVQALSQTGKTVWGRRSVFRVSDKPLLVSEYFLPTLFRVSDRESVNPHFR